MTDNRRVTKVFGEINKKMRGEKRKSEEKTGEVKQNVF